MMRQVLEKNLPTISELHTGFAAGNGAAGAAARRCFARIEEEDETIIEIKGILISLRSP